MVHVKSPFKFLDAYTKADVDIFFGREQETQDLYEALSGVKHLLVYGPSGSGKTSLVECGLRNQFSDADWYALTIRKGHNINSSVFLAINEALEDKIPLDSKTKLPVNPTIGFGTAIEKLFGERYQPVYLLFDQFEELLISGGPQEKSVFFANLNQLIRSRLPSRVLIIMREEFIGHFSEFEQICPSIFQHRFRVEKMGRTQVQEVIQDMLEAPLYHAHFEISDSEGLAKKILEKLPDRRKVIELSHVQVFLGELWDRANTQNETGVKPFFSSDLLRKNDNLESVLDSFLKKQLNELDEIYGEGISLELLAIMISEKFTKLQLSEADINVELEIKNVTVERPVNDLLEALQKRRILRAIKVSDERQYEISHDALALVVGQNLSDEMKMREKALDVYNTYAEQSGLFSQENIDHLRAFEPYQAYPDDLQKRIKKSEAKIKTEEDEKVARHRKQLRRTRIFASVIFIISIGAIVASVFAVFGEIEAKKQEELANKNLQNFQELSKTLIGAKYEGGTVFHWIEEVGKHGLIAAESDLDSLYTWEQAKMMCAKFSVTVDGITYDDWRLPTKDELNALFVNRAVVGGFGIGSYWSSSEVELNDTEASNQGFNSGNQYYESKHYTNRVRPVREY